MSSPDDRAVGAPSARSRGGLASRRSARLLVVDDEPPILEMLLTTLAFAGFDVRAARDCRQALEEAARFQPELALLDVMLPDGSGFDLCRALREENPQLGVIFLTARDRIDDKLTGLALGGDDYVTKPFIVAEVVARLNGLLRRIGDPQRGSQLRVADLELDDDTHRVRRGPELIELSPTEFKLLRYLLQNAELVVSKQQILTQVWRYDFLGDSAVVEKFISQLRRKIDPEGRPPLLHTVRGFGYVLREPNP